MSVLKAGSVMKLCMSAKLFTLQEMGEARMWHTWHVDMRPGLSRKVHVRTCLAALSELVSKSQVGNVGNVPLYIYICIYKHVHAYTHTYTYIYINTHVCAKADCKGISRPFRLLSDLN